MLVGVFFKTAIEILAFSVTILILGLLERILSLGV